jgi:hydrogenase/urease accessory protein HupE
LQEQGRPSLMQALKHLLWLPIQTFFLIYLRHKGFVDGWQGLVFALFSGLHHPVAYLKYLRLLYAKKN